MPKKKKENKRLYLIFLIVILVPALFSVYWFVLRQPSSSVKEGSEDNVVVDEREDKLPNYVAKDLTEFYKEVLNDAKDWSSDYRIHSVTATTDSTELNGEKVYFGFEEGKFSSWMFEIYSPSKAASVMYSYSDGEGDIGEEMKIEEKYVIQMYNQKPYFNNLGALESTQQVYTTLVSRGLNLGETSHIYMYLGDGETTQLYDDRYVWRVDERSNTEVGEYGVPKVLKTYYIDGKTLSVIK